MPIGEVGIRYFTYDALNRRSSLKDELANVWYFDYDEDSNLTSQKNPLGALTTWGYDADNQKTSQTDPLSRIWYWTYDAAGNASSLKDGRAKVTYYQVDVVYNQTRIDYPDSTSHYFEFDLARQLTAFADPTGRTTESYDNLGRLTLRTNPGSQSLYYEYDGVGNRTNLKDPDGKAVYYIYDSADRMEHVEAPDYSGTIAYYQYTAANERNFERKKNGVLSYYEFDSAGRTSSIMHRGTGGVVEGWDYTRDEVGNITLQTRKSDSMRTYWNYDAANRITKEAWRTNAGSDVYGFAYSYDNAGNRNLKQGLLAGGVNTYWNYDLADQMTIQKSNATTTVYFTYDDNGNLSVEHDVDASAGRTYYDYEPRNLLSRVDFPGATATNYFYYNAPGERTRKDDSTAQKKYTWDRLIPIVEKNLSNTTTQRMLKGYSPVDGIGDFVLQDVNGTTIYPHKNQVGTTMRQTNTGGASVNTYEYDAWGQPFVTTEGTAQQYRFTGKELDPDFVDFNSVNRRTHFPVRTYSAFRSTFIQTDPLIRALIDSSSVILSFGYAMNNPSLNVDPLGLMTEQECKDQEKECRNKIPFLASPDTQSMGETACRLAYELCKQSVPNEDPFYRWLDEQAQAKKRARECYDDPKGGWTPFTLPEFPTPVKPGGGQDPGSGGGIVCGGAAAGAAEEGVRRAGEEGIKKLPQLLAGLTVGELLLAGGLLIIFTLPLWMKGCSLPPPKRRFRICVPITPPTGGGPPDEPTYHPGVGRGLCYYACVDENGKPYTKVENPAGGSCIPHIDVSPPSARGKWR